MYGNILVVMVDVENKFERKRVKFWLFFCREWLKSGNWGKSRESSLIFLRKILAESSLLEMVFEI